MWSSSGVNALESLSWAFARPDIVVPFAIVCVVIIGLMLRSRERAGGDSGRGLP